MKQPSASYAGIYLLAAAAILAALIGGIALLHGAPSSSANAQWMAGAALLASAVLGLIVLFVALPIAMDLAATRQSTSIQQRQMIAALNEKLQGISNIMSLISDQQLISDRAKAVAFRENDHDTIRQALQEEVGRQNWEAALQLANDIENSFGYKQEAEGLRTQINEQRDQTQRRRMAELLGRVDAQIKAEAWGAALLEAQQVMALYPNDPQIQELPREIEQRRQMRKQQLRDSWQDAVNRHDVDGSIEILKRLDVYLTPAEAESMQEIARNVFKEKREDLRTRFALAVQEHKWIEAIQLGDEIIQDFPNTRIAQEVRDKMDVLRQRAREPDFSAASLQAP